MSRGRNWCCTINNPVDADRDLLNALDTSYLIIGDEVGEEGTPHLQVYFRLNKVQRFGQLKKQLPKAHLELAKGNPQQNRDYCMKDGTFIESGTIPMTGGQSTAQKYELAWEAAKNGDLEDVPKDLRIKHYNTFKNIVRDHMTRQEELDAPCGVWLYGKSGNGKTTKARTEYPNHYNKCVNKWWDGYQGEDNVLLDDIDPSHSYISRYLKIWADKFDFTAEVKGCTMQIRPKRFIVTSQYKIEDIWADEATREALNRRFEVIHVKHFSSQTT